MHPDPHKREEDLAEHVEMWQDKMMRLEVHGDGFKMAPVFKMRPHGRGQDVPGAVEHGQGLLEET